MFAPPDATYCQFTGFSYNTGGDAVEIAEIISGFGLVNAYQALKLTKGF